MTQDDSIYGQVDDRLDILGVRATHCLHQFVMRDQLRWEQASYEEVRQACLDALGELGPNDGSAFDGFRCSTTRDDVAHRISQAQ